VHARGRKKRGKVKYVRKRPSFDVAERKAISENLLGGERGGKGRQSERGSGFSGGVKEGKRMDRTSLYRSEGKRKKTACVIGKILGPCPKGRKGSC